MRFPEADSLGAGERDMRTRRVRVRGGDGISDRAGQSKRAALAAAALFGLL